MESGGHSDRLVDARQQGDIVLIPFPFTDQSGTKQRPALVVSPSGFAGEDIILCAITSQVPQHLSRWDVRLSPSDVVERRLPEPSVI
jgi:mRNA interferase MazF